jgi:hypothetical protein
MFDVGNELRQPLLGEGVAGRARETP